MKVIKLFTSHFIFTLSQNVGRYNSQLKYLPKTGGFLRHIHFDTTLEYNIFYREYNLYLSTFCVSINVTAFFFKILVEMYMKVALCKYVNFEVDITEGKRLI